MLECSIKHLYLIGNGFDVHHGINSRYSDLEKWLESNKRNLYSRMFQVYGIEGTDLWSAFEDELGNISPEAILGQNVYASFVVADKKNGMYLNFEDMTEVMPEIGYTLSQLFLDLQEAFREWINDLNAPNETKKLKFPTEDSRFISFNYTKTLADVYEIPTEQILYIHGSIAENADLIFGHNKTKEEILQSWGAAENEDDAEALDDAAKEMSIIYKPVQTIISRHSAYWEQLSDVGKIHVWGMSLSDADVQYLRRINDVVSNDIEWEFSCFTKEDYKRAPEVIQQLELKNARICRLSDYE